MEANGTPHSSTGKPRGQPRLQKRTQLSPAITPTPKNPTASNGSWANTSQERFRQGMMINEDLQLNLCVIKGTGRFVV